MAEASKIRLVRCPKCENLLPELADYSVYQCGGCGAVLRAKKKNGEGESDATTPTTTTTPTTLELNEEDVRIVNGYVINEDKSPGSSSSLEISAVKSEKKASISGTEAETRSEEEDDDSKGLKDEEQLPRKSRFMKYPDDDDEGPSNYRMKMKSDDQAAQFLRKLDELKEQLSRSGEMANDSAGRMFGFAEDRFLRRNHYQEPVSYPSRHGRSHLHHLHHLHRPHRPYLHYQEPFEASYTYRNPNPSNSSCSCFVRFPNHFTNPNDYKSRVINRTRTTMGPPTSARKARCYPVSGGAPFLTCHNCLELLHVPKMASFISDEETQMKIKCGACSTILLLRLLNKKLYVSVSDETPARERLHFLSEDYDTSGYDFHSMGHGFAADMTSIPSGSPYSSEDDDSQERKEPNSSNLPPPATGSPIKSRVVNRIGNGNRSGRSENVTSRQNSMKDASVATEIDASFQEYLNTDTSQEDDQPKKIKQNFAGILKKSLKELSRSIQPADHGSTVNVTVNGFPISDRLLKKAEKLAGSIQPGNYWYDFRAGFWGLMTGPCLGIIPPYIEEFNKPMPKNCSSGNTRVCVNGRELHQKDLELLSMRGLPTTRGRSYLIEISGRVLDAESGDELDSLGKLAPTVERSKHGFGMKPPKMRV